TQSKPKLEQRNLRLHKLAALAPVSDELLEDATALDAFIGNEAGRAIGYQVDEGIGNGGGAGKPVGCGNAVAAGGVSKECGRGRVTKESGQGNGTLVAANIANMYARMPAPYLGNAVWLINQAALPQVMAMTLADQPIYTAPNGIVGAPNGTLLGRPVFLSQH